MSSSWPSLAASLSDLSKGPMHIVDLCRVGDDHAVVQNDQVLQCVAFLLHDAQQHVSQTIKTPLIPHLSSCSWTATQLTSWSGIKSQCN